MSQWRTAPRGAAAWAPRTQPPVGTVMPQDGPWPTVAMWQKGSGALALPRHMTLEKELPGEGGGGQSGCKSRVGDLQPQSAFGANRGHVKNAKT